MLKGCKTINVLLLFKNLMSSESLHPFKTSFPFIFQSRSAPKEFQVIKLNDTIKWSFNKNNRIIIAWELNRAKGNYKIFYYIPFHHLYLLLFALHTQKQASHWNRLISFTKSHLSAMKECARIILQKKKSSWGIFIGKAVVAIIIWRNILQSIMR